MSANGLYGGISLQTLRELHDKLAKAPDAGRRDNEARRDWEWAVYQAGAALLAAAEEKERLLALVRMIACNHDPEWGRQLARRHLDLDLEKALGD